MKNKEEKAYNRIVILGLLLFFDIFFFILLIKFGFSTLIGIYGGINVYIFPYLVYNFGKSLFTYVFKIKEGTFKIFFFFILINIPFLLPLANYLISGRIDFGGFTGYENPSTLLKLFIILDGFLLPIIVLSYSSSKNEKLEESDKEDYDEGEEKLEEPEQGNVNNNEYENLYGDEYGNTETNSEQYSFSNSNTVKEIESISQNKILSEKSNLKKEEIKQLVYDKDSSKNREEL